MISEHDSCCSNTMLKIRSQKRTKGKERVEEQIGKQTQKVVPNDDRKRQNQTARWNVRGTQGDTEYQPHNQYSSKNTNFRHQRCVTVSSFLPSHAKYSHTPIFPWPVLSNSAQTGWLNLIIYSLIKHHVLHGHPVITQPHSNFSFHVTSKPSFSLSHGYSPSSTMPTFSSLPRLVLLNFSHDTSIWVACVCVFDFIIEIPQAIIWTKVTKYKLFFHSWFKTYQEPIKFIHNLGMHTSAWMWVSMFKFKFKPSWITCPPIKASTIWVSSSRIVSLLGLHTSLDQGFRLRLQLPHHRKIADKWGLMLMQGLAKSLLGLQTAIWNPAFHSILRWN